MKSTLIALCFVFTTLSKLIAEPGIDARAQRLVGTWSEENSEGNLRMSGEKTFHRDGTAEGWAKVWRLNASGEESFLQKISYKSRWRIEGDILIAFDVHTSPKDLLDPSKEIRDLILLLEPEVFRFKADDGKIWVLTKKADDASPDSKSTRSSNQ